MNRSATVFDGFVCVEASTGFSTHCSGSGHSAHRVSSKPTNQDDDSDVSVDRLAASGAIRIRRWLGSLLLLVLWVAAPSLRAEQISLNGPADSGEFGKQVFVLPNGNVVVTDPLFDAPGPIANVGSVYLYRPDGTLISTLRGSTANDRVGDAGIEILANGNYVVMSRNWDRVIALPPTTVTNAGAVTFCNAATGVDGAVSDSNSLVGRSTNDMQSTGIYPLSNGNYLVSSSSWDNLLPFTTIADVGAVTFGSGLVGVTGEISASNSLVGSSVNNQVGLGGIQELGTGNYLVLSRLWDSASTQNVGAVTFGSGLTGVTGPVSSTNSLVGSTTGDMDPVYVFTLSNGSYVLGSQLWDNGSIVDAGAATFGSGVSGVSGVISSSNSLVGNTENQALGNSVTALSNGKYVVNNVGWDNPTTGKQNVGAVVLAGVNGITGNITAANALVGSQTDDLVGSSFALNNGNFVVVSGGWDNGPVIDAGAVTWVSGNTGLVGQVSAANSLVGATTGDLYSAQITALNNGNYVVSSPNWDNGLLAVDAGAVTWASGSVGLTGTISSINSLVGSTANDRIGSLDTIKLNNGNFVVVSPEWDNGSADDAGAVTWVSGTTGLVGPVTSSNSLVGSQTFDLVGDGNDSTSGSLSNFAVISPSWDSAAVEDAGAITFANGASPISGPVTSSNSLVGTAVGDFSNYNFAYLNNGQSIFAFNSWDNGTIAQAGAVVFVPSPSGLTGVITPSIALVGSTAGDQVGQYFGTYNNGHYVVESERWDNGSIVDAGAFTLGLPDGSVVGPITNVHSVLGTVTNSGNSQTHAYDEFRNQLVVGQPASNRVVLHRSGSDTTVNLADESPDPSTDVEPVTFTATVSSSSAPNAGRVTFRASGGESCTDTTATPSTATSVTFSCSITFNTGGETQVYAEYTGSTAFAYDRSVTKPHTTTLLRIFGDGFE